MFMFMVWVWVWVRARGRRLLEGLRYPSRKANV